VKDIEKQTNELVPVEKEKQSSEFVLFDKLMYDLAWHKA
jgi:hypothetical protein